MNVENGKYGVCFKLTTRAGTVHLNHQLQHVLYRPEDKGDLSRLSPLPLEIDFQQAHFQLKYLYLNLSVCILYLAVILFIFVDQLDGRASDCPRAQGI